jgi:hypothetical protein
MATQSHSCAISRSTAACIGLALHSNDALPPPLRVLATSPGWCRCGHTMHAACWLASWRLVAAWRRKRAVAPWACPHGGVRRVRGAWGAALPTLSPESAQQGGARAAAGAHHTWRRRTCGVDKIPVSQRRRCGDSAACGDDGACGRAQAAALGASRWPAARHACMAHSTRRRQRAARSGAPRPPP